MKRVPWAAGLVVALALLAGSFYAGRASRSVSADNVRAPTPASAEASRKVLYWHDPMVPAQRFDKPGKSPFMDMQLVPVYAESESASTGVAITPGVQQNLGIRYARVRRADVSASFDAIGTVQFNERLSTSVQTRVAGYVERLAVRAPMERVHKGQALATVFAPDWLGPLSELLALQRAGVSADLVAAARERLKAMSIPGELVRQSEAAGVAQARYTLSSPMNGVVAELGVREGVAVAPGMTLFRIAGLDTVWAVADVPEAQALRLRPRQKITATLQADAARTFDGVLAEIIPQVDASTRTLKARIVVDNRQGQLTPGMLLRLRLQGTASARLVVASEAVIRTGTRAVVIVRNDKGGFEPRDVSIGAEAGDDIEVTSGLREGEQVVASGQFLIDSEAGLRSALGNLATPLAAAASSAAASAPEALHTAEGSVEQATREALTISHGPVASLQWPAMTMGFAKSNPAAFAGIQRGDRVRFQFKAGGPSGYELVKVEKLAGAGR